MILAVRLYLSGWRKRDSVRMTAAFVALAAGLLVHYSAGPYVVFFALHYLLAVFRTRPAKWKELAAIAVSCGLLLFTWFGWSMAAYGVKPTFASNTSITASKQVQGSILAKIAGNVSDSIVPRISYDPAQVHLFDQPYAPAVVRDNVFLLYNTNVIFSMGLIGGPLVVWFLIAAFRSGKGKGRERNFWLMLIGFSLVVGLAVVGERDYFGSAHLTLLPLELLGLTFLATRFFSRRWIAYLIVAGCAIDFSMGIFLHARVQHLDNTTEHTYFTGLGFSDGQFLIGAPGPDSLNMAAWRNWLAKHQLAVCRNWLAMGEGVPARRSGARPGEGGSAGGDRGAVERGRHGLARLVRTAWRRVRIAGRPFRRQRCHVGAAGAGGDRAALEDGATGAAGQCAGRSETKVIAIPTQTMKAALATGR